MFKNLICILFLAVAIFGCKPTATITLPEQTIVVDDPNKIPERPVYNAAKTKLFDLDHSG